ncbi:glycine betaine ABC transporter substrate-binding protein [Paraburkholderia bonniea]|uniref:glycine betaine ABC transporter substrate-binding protein n=1 Tax=Paraburkholderia bonniea TaxID=2152891 RepID=UPI00257454A8|nr:glycine betaine ABC transporter substrate-binding protein [Paraburkholderia bonniea]WJF91502.1 glycine betaine ABC transporter substrate-binding protein [Paraburkholderia bonniea]WJF94820.1 glycine betaine ABC transporter substrate-binding protein [Paraburkholderia bonniea]
MNRWRRWLCLGATANALLASAAALAQTSAAAPARPTIKIGYVEGWDDSVATSNIAARVIEKRLGYPVQLVPVAAGIMWQGVARGDLDATLSAWLPVTQGAYWAQFQHKVKNLGANFPNARIGLVVPATATEKSIADLAASKAAYGSRIVGIDAGAGVMQKASEAINTYQLGYQLMPSSGSAMTIELARALQAHKPVVVTGWAPHWMFAKWQLKFLDDPKQVFGAAEHVDNVIHPGLENKAPPVVAFLKRFQWKPGEIEQVMLASENGVKPAVAAEAWLTTHPERLKDWLAGVTPRP